MRDRVIPLDAVLSVRAVRAAGSRRVVRKRLLRPATGWLALSLVASFWLLAGCASRPQSGVYHTVRAGETLYSIGRRYRVPHDVVRRVNRIRDEKFLRVGTKLWIPRPSKKGYAVPSASQLAANRAKAKRAAAKEAKRSSLHFRWPLSGRLTSRFGIRGGRPHEGIDLAAPRGTAVLAAEAGEVIHAGRLGAYGNCVIVKHSGDYRSVYAHATKTLVRKGQRVGRGQKIALVGSTGRSTGPHLHFEIRRSETPRDPILYLP